MAKKHILIVDDEVSILEVLKSSLRKQSDAYQVETATDGYIALEKLNQQHFDLVVTDYKMMGLNGLELLEAIRTIQPETRVIMMTAYGNADLEAKARQLKAHHFLQKPLEISAFRQIVQESLADVAINRPGILILSENRYRQVSQILEKLQSDIGARCTFLVDASGQIIARTGNVQGFPIDAIASLLGGGIATITEAGRALDGDEDAINLAYREGQDVNIYALNIGQHLLLILIIERTPYSSKLGSVWYYAQNTARELTRELNEKGLTTGEALLDENSMEELDNEFDKLFNSEPPETPVDPEPPGAPVPQVARRVSAKLVTHPPEEPCPEPADTPPQPQLFSYEEAVKRGLIPSDITKPRE